MELFEFQAELICQRLCLQATSDRLMGQIARVYSLFLDYSQIGALSRLDKDVVAAAWFVAKTLCMASLSFVIVLGFHVSKPTCWSKQASCFPGLTWILTCSSCQNSAGVSEIHLCWLHTHTLGAEGKLTRPINLGVIFVWFPFVLTGFDAVCLLNVMRL